MDIEVTTLIDSANALAKEERFQEAIPKLELASSLGSAEANYALGTWYFNGIGFEKNIERAVEYWDKAANLGSIDAMQDLGILYERGEFIEKDLERAALYFIQGSLCGCGECQYELSRFFYYGIYFRSSRVIHDLLRDLAHRNGYQED